MTFADNLQQLPAIPHIKALELINDEGHVVATLVNGPGTAGSARIYAALAAQFGAITPAAAEQGLQWFAEHTATARQQPGSHPNIDRLLQLIATGQSLQVNIVPQQQ